MSNRTRTLFQKARRNYIAKCKKDGSKPMDVDSFYKKWQKNMQNDASAEQTKTPKQKKSAKKEKPSVKAAAEAVTVHKIRNGDVVEFAGVTPARFALAAVKMSILAYCSLIAGAHSADKKCGKCKDCGKTEKKPSKR